MRAHTPQTLMVPEEAPETILDPSGEYATLLIPYIPALLSVLDATKLRVAASVQGSKALADSRG